MQGGEVGRGLKGCCPPTSSLASRETRQLHHPPDGGVIPSESDPSEARRSPGLSALSRLLHGLPWPQTRHWPRGLLLAQATQSSSPNQTTPSSSQPSGGPSCARQKMKAGPDTHTHLSAHDLFKGLHAERGAPAGRTLGGPCRQEGHQRMGPPARDGSRPHTLTASPSAAALARWLSWWEHRPVHQNTAGSIPNRGVYGK